ncbi:hypothetical protein, partial [Telluribacter humicola]
AAPLLFIYTCLLLLFSNNKESLTTIDGALFVVATALASSQDFIALMWYIYYLRKRSCNLCAAIL